MNRFEGTSLASRAVRRSLEGALSLWEKMSGAFVTYHARPKHASDAGIKSDPRPDLPPFALVLQGPVLHKDDFTLETVRLYKRTFPDAMLILSTWKSEPPAVLDAFKQLGAEVLANDPPAKPGQQNFNYQLVSSNAGIARAAERGAHYAMKSRTDQRLCAPNLQSALMNLLDAFPLKNAGVQKRRLIATGLNTFKFRLYGVSDMLQFGHIDDLRLYWGAAQTENFILPSETLTRREFALRRVCEVYLATEFLTAVGRKPRWTLEDSWRAIGEHFCLVDPAALDLYWPKYERLREYRRTTYSRSTADEFVTFLEWMTYYTGEAFQRPVPESVLDA